MARINRVPIFRAGSHPGSGNGATREFSESDLDSLVASFDELKLSGRVPAKYGHVAAGDPAIGWVSRVWREGKQLLGDLIDVPAKVYEAIKANLYKFTSAEIVMGLKANGREYPFVLYGLALLGAERPAVDGQRPLSELLMARRPEPFLRTASPVTFSIEPSTVSKGDKRIMNEEELKALLAKFAALEGNVTKLTTDLAASNKRNDELAVELKARNDAEAKAKIEAHRGALRAVFTAAIERKAILPAVQAKFEKLVQFADDAAVIKVTTDQAKEFVTDNTDAKAVAKFAAEQKRAAGTGGDKQDAWDKDGDEPADEAVARLARKMVFSDASGKLRYSEAATRVIELNPELGRAWMNIHREVADTAEA